MVVEVRVDVRRCRSSRTLFRMVFPSSQKTVVPLTTRRVGAVVSAPETGEGAPPAAGIFITLPPVVSVQ